MSSAMMMRVWGCMKEAGRTRTGLDVLSLSLFLPGES
jgi:hypothetical protein